MRVWGEISLTGSRGSNSGHNNPKRRKGGCTKGESFAEKGKLERYWKKKKGKAAAGDDCTISKGGGGRRKSEEWT